MPEINKSVLVRYSAQQMFELVELIEDYPKFLPWCGGALVSSRDAAKTLATICIDFRGIRQSFTTENLKQPPYSMQMQLVEGPFRSLSGSWRFTDLANMGCKVEFRLAYEFSGKLLEKAVGPVFSYIGNNIVDSFVRRAEQVYG
jgi:ribosome-associated toxin RatA of RatAB toxin-antitoxin module